MPPDFIVEYPYLEQPRVPLRISSPETGRRTIAFALIDTGADITVLDTEISERLGLNLENRPLVRMAGLGGASQVGRRAEVEISVLGNDALTGIISVVFMPNVGARLSNLVGLDFLAFIDFGLSHSNRLMYFGIPERV